MNKGTLGVILDGRRRLLVKGEGVQIPPQTPCTFWNAVEGDVRFLSDVQPAGQLKTYW